VKTAPDHSLKTLILSAIYDGHQTSREIQNYISSTPYIVGSEEYYYSNESGLSSGINYLKNTGFITIYPKDENGRPIKSPTPKRPYRYFLNDRAFQYLKNPNKKMDRDALVAEMAREMAKDIIKDDEAFKEAVEEKVKELKPIKIENRIEKPVFKPINQIKKVQFYDGTEREIEFDSNNDLKEVQELKNQIKQLKANHTATVQEYDNYIQEIESSRSQSDIEAIKKYERNLTRDEKIQQRYALAVEYANNRYFLDEYFFQQWEGDYIIVILKKLMELGQVMAPEYVDIFGRKSDLYKRRKSRIKRIISGSEIVGCKIVIIEIKDSGIVIDSPYLEAENTLKL